MKKFQILRYLKRFRVLILLVALLGSAATYIYTDKQLRYTASVVIRYTNSEISDGYTPSGAKLDVGEIYSSAVISQAMNYLGNDGPLNIIRSRCSVDEVISEEQQDINQVKTNEILENIIGEKVSFVRPPYGSWDKSFEKELNMFPVLWNIDPLDWCSHNAECIAAKVVEKAGDGDIILMHDYYDTSVTAALEVVDVLQKRGFQFVTVEEILFD